MWSPLLLIASNLAFVGIVCIPLAMLVFPDGRPPSPRWRPLVGGTVVGAALAIIGGGLASEHLEGDGFSIDNPLWVDELSQPAAIAAGFGFALIVAATVGAVVGVVVRWRRGRPEEQAQIKWVALVGSVALVVLLLAQLTGADSQVVAVAVAVLLYGGIPAAVAVAVLKYRLYDIDALINRTVVYAVVTVGLASLYLIVVGLTTNLVGRRHTDCSWTRCRRLDRRRLRAVSRMGSARGEPAPVRLPPRTVRRRRAIG